MSYNIGYRGPYYVYAFMNDTNEYLYIGRTRDIHQRIAQHKGTKHWFPEVKEVWCQEIFTEEYLDVNEHERTLIDYFKPKYNKTAHKQPKLETPPIYECEFVYVQECDA